jgi:hypothetical protein
MRPAAMTSSRRYFAIVLATALSVRLFVSVQAHGAAPDAGLGLSQPVAIAAAAPLESSRRNAADKFTIYSSTIAGEDRILIVSDPKRELNHARVSPDLKSVVFTRYNRRNKDDEALETTSYLESEAVLCRIDGRDCEAIIPARQGIVAANACWTPDGTGILFVTNDTPSASAGIKLLDLTTREISTFYLPADLLVADPHMVGQTVVLPGKLKTSPHLSRLYLVDAVTKSRRQLTDPHIENFEEMVPPLGDHDPKLSPDGKTIAVMRHMAQHDWRTFVIDIATGAEKDLSGPDFPGAVPEWSGDGKLLVFWTIVQSDLKRSGLYTIRPDGGERQRVPLPNGFFYSMPAFFPGSGSGPTSKIIYSAKLDPRL